MLRRKLLPLFLSFVMLAGVFTPNTVFGDEAKRQRRVYIHAGGANPAETTDVSTIYADEVADIYFAVDNPNKGDFVNGVHEEPQYDMNGYTVTIYFDPTYFDYAGDSQSPIDYTVPDDDISTSGSGSENVGDDDIVDDVPTSTGYYVRYHGSGTKVIDGKTYKSAYITVFFNGGYIPQKKDGVKWYNLCKLPLKPLTTGSTQVFIDTSGEEGRSLELFAKNRSDQLNEQTFSYFAEHDGYHTITIKDKSRPAAPTADIPEGSYTETQWITLSAESDCDIYYSLHGEEPHLYDGNPIEISFTTTITCYAMRKDLKKSNTARFEYKIIPKSPFVFKDEGGDKKLIPNAYYEETDAFTVFVSDKSVYGKIDNESEIYYTFSDVSEENFKESDSPENGWFKLDKNGQSIEISKTVKLRLITKKYEDFSVVTEYKLGIKPTSPWTDYPSGEYSSRLEVPLKCEKEAYEIYYTTDGTDPCENGIRYNSAISVSSNTTLRAVCRYDGVYSDVVSYDYIISEKDDFGITAFYPSGTYEGDTPVTLTANNPEYKIMYSTDGGQSWLPYESTLLIKDDTEITAKAGFGDTWGENYKFTYKILPLPPHFAPESTSFVSSSNVSVYCMESYADTTDSFDLYYTVDGSDPTVSNTRIQADTAMDSAKIYITNNTLVKAVVLKNGRVYSDVVENYYAISPKKPANPLMTLAQGNYTEKIDGENELATFFDYVVNGTDIYYTVSYDGSYTANPELTDNKYVPGTPIEIKGHTIIKAVAINAYGVRSDVVVFEYNVTPEAPTAAPSAVINADKLPVVPVSAVKGSKVEYEINGFSNSFLCENGVFYVDTSNGNAYSDKACTSLLGDESTSTFSSVASITLRSKLDGVESFTNKYSYKLADSSEILAAPYADKVTGEYEETKDLLGVKLGSLNDGDTIFYRTSSAAEWQTYNGETLKFDKDTVLQVISKKGGVSSEHSSYVYYFVPLAPKINLPSGRYVLSDNPEFKIVYDSRAPISKIQNDEYEILYRKNGDMRDNPYVTDYTRSVDETSSFKAYIKNTVTGRISKNTVHYYIIEPESAATGSVYIPWPYNVSRISASELGNGEYANGIKLFTQNKNASIMYFYSYTMKGSEDSVTTTNMTYSESPIVVNPSMTSISITAWLVDSSGVKIANSDFFHEIEFVHLDAPKTSLGSERVEFPYNTEYTFENAYKGDSNIMILYTLDGTSDPKTSGTLYKEGEKLRLTSAVTVRAVYLSACGADTCSECMNGKKQLCPDKIFGPVGEYKYIVPTTVYGSGSGGGGGGGGGSSKAEQEYTTDIFGNTHKTHVSYISGYPDGSVRPGGKISREEMTSILYRITPHDYEKPFVASGEVFPDVSIERWSVRDIEYMAEKEVVSGYPDGEFKPGNPLTRAEFASLICRFAGLEATEAKNNGFNDLESTHWAYDDILTLVNAGLIEGYENGSFRPESDISRAEVMTVINNLLGRNPSEEYLKSLDFNPYSDLEADKWYYAAVLEATVTHNYLLDKNGLEIKWENCK